MKMRKGLTEYELLKHIFLKKSDFPKLFYKSCKDLPLQWKAHAKKYIHLKVFV